MHAVLLRLMHYLRHTKNERQDNTTTCTIAHYIIHTYSMHHTMCNAAYFNYTIIVMQKEMEGREETFQRMRQTGEVGREKRERERERGRVTHCVCVIDPSLINPAPNVPCRALLQRSTLPQLRSSLDCSHSQRKTRTWWRSGARGSISSSSVKSFR